MAYDLLLANATVVNWFGRQNAHIAVSGGTISALFDARTAIEQITADKIVDCEGKAVIPGGIDGHCHVAQRTGHHLTGDTYQTASRAALMGGTTTIFDFGIPQTRDSSPRRALETKIAQISGSYCDVAMHGSVIHWTDETESDLEWMWEHGVTSVKAYTTNRSTTYATSAAIINTMQWLAERDGLLYVHAEHNAIIEDAENRLDGKLTILDLPRSRPKIAELTSIHEVLGLAEYSGGRVYFVHQSFADAVEVINKARRTGLKVYSETCPHYLMFDEGVYASPLAKGFAGSPPLRTARDRVAMIRALAAGDVDTVGSDHSNFSWLQKNQYSQLGDLAYGLPGVETRLAATHTALCTEGGVSLERFVEVVSAAPARINGLPTKGVIAVGYDADLVVLSQEPRRVKADELEMGTGWSPYQEMTLTGWPHQVFFKGQLVVDEGIFVGNFPQGRYLHRQ